MCVWEGKDGEPREERRGRAYGGEETESIGRREEGEHREQRRGRA